MSEQVVTTYPASTGVGGLQTSAIRGLAYVGVNVRNLSAWCEVFEHVLGVSPGTQEDGRCTFQLDDRVRRVHVATSDEDGLAYVGWELADDLALDSLESTMTDAGLDVRRASEVECRYRGVTAMIWVEDPNGYRVEFSYGLTWTFTPQHTLARQPVALATLKLAHIVIGVPEFDATMKFYRQLLGFKLTDYRNERVFFLRSGEQHHDIALLRTRKKRMLHIAIEYQSLDDVGRAWDVAERMGIVARGLGRHSNDRSISFYVHGELGFEMEIGTFGIEVDNRTWNAHEIDAGTEWGHRPSEAALKHAAARQKA